MPNATICNDSIIETPTVGISSETLVDHEYLDVFIGGSSNSEVFVKGLKFSEESGYSKVEHIMIPDEINGYPVTTICDTAFFNEGGSNSLDFIKSVKIGDNVRYIGRCAFLDSHIESIELGKNVEIIEQGAFECCYFLNEIELNNNLRVIKGSSLAFGDYFNSTYIPQMPESIEYIDSYCFGGIRNTNTFVIPKGLKFWGGNIVNAKKLVVLSAELNFGEENIINSECIVYCYENSTIHQKLKSGEINNEYHLIENAYLTSETVDISEDYVISGLQGGLTENDLKSYLKVEGEAEIRVSDEVVKTGTK